MTFLEGVQRLAALAGVTSPGSVSTAVTRHADLVRYYQIAHEEIQNKYFDWFFLWSEGEIPVTPGTAVYSDSDVGSWDIDRLYLDGNPLKGYQYPDYDTNDAAIGTPKCAVILPNNSVKLHPTPSQSHTLAYEYYKAPAVLALDADTPLIPERFQMAIVGRALVLYANFEAAEELRMQGSEIYQQYMETLENHQLSLRQQTHGRGSPTDILVVVE